MRDLRPLLLAEAAAFAIAALVHFGVLVDGFQDETAGTAESIIGLVLLSGAAVSWLRPNWTRAAALLTQGFALLGSLVGLYVAVVIGPTTIPDMVFHVGIVAVLAWGIGVAWRATGSGVTAAG